MPIALLVTGTGVAYALLAMLCRAPTLAKVGVLYILASVGHWFGWWQ